MIQWVDELCKDWGRAQHRLLFGFQGWPTRSMLGRLIDEGIIGASSNQFTMQYPEVLSAENLKTANAIKTLPEEPRALITIHYVFRLRARDKCERIEMPIRTYYARINDAHRAIESALQLMEIRELRKRFAQKSFSECSTNQGLGSTFTDNVAAVSR